MENFNSKIIQKCDCVIYFSNVLIDFEGIIVVDNLLQETQQCTDFSSTRAHK